MAHPSNYHLPEEYKFSHEYAFFLHDCLVDFIVCGEEHGIFKSVEIEFKTQEDADAFPKLQGDALCDWMMKNGYAVEMCALSYKQLVVALLSDFCHFVHEALSCSERGKLTVAFALLRKPFKDNLFYLECLLAEPADFVVGFQKNDIKSVFNSFRDRKKEIIKLANGKIEHPNAFSPEFLYELRYAPAPYSLDTYCDKALHLVTTRPDRQTEDHNLNFIFSDNDARLSQWNFLYINIPGQLFYTLEVVTALMKTLVKFELPTEASMQSLAGFSLWSARIGNKSPEEQRRVVEKIFHSSDLECPFCDNKNLLCWETMEEVYYHLKLTCPNCKMLILPFEKAQKRIKWEFYKRKVLSYIFFWQRNDSKKPNKR